jgi:beta-lactamase superfamily II metal-dependent hydrolase
MNNQDKLLDKLLVRVYDVGFGDCIYIRVPDRYPDPDTGQVKQEQRHILIDCGTVGKIDYDERSTISSSYDPIRKALSDLRKMLPEVKGQRRLDLLVVTHPHQDHISGFSPSRMRGISSSHVWLSVFMDKHHTQAKKSFAFEELAFRATLSLLRRGLRVGPGLLEAMQAMQGNDKYLEMLQKTLPKKSVPKEPLYVSRDIADRRNQDERRVHSIVYKEDTTCFQGFEEEGTRLRVLAPEWDIDGHYLDSEKLHYLSLLDRYPEPDDAEFLLSMAEDSGSIPKGAATMEKVDLPPNISQTDFQALRHGMRYSALRFHQDDDHLKNDVSIVLLLEWRGRKLLFTGDAEWRGGYEKDKHNGGWDVLLEKEDQAGHKHLAKLDFLKVGHHGSENATPWYSNTTQQPILDELLPKAQRDNAKIVVSTCRTDKWKESVPCSGLVGKKAGLLREHGTVLLTNEEGDLEEGQHYIQVTFD